MKKQRLFDSEFLFKRIQFKSIDKIKRFAKLLEEMEIEFWIRVCNIELEEVFICWDITQQELNTLNSPMENNLKEIIQQLDFWYMPEDNKWLK